jgi:hypothetical protein
MRVGTKSPPERQKNAGLSVAGRDNTSVTSKLHEHSSLNPLLSFERQLHACVDALYVFRLAPARPFSKATAWFSRRETYGDAQDQNEIRINELLKQRTFSERNTGWTLLKEHVFQRNKYAASRRIEGDTGVGRS